MEAKKYVIDLSLSDRLEELKDSFFDDIAFVKYSDHKAVVEKMQNKIDELGDHLRYIVSQLDYCPLCGAYREEQGAITHEEGCECELLDSKGD